MIIAPMDIKNEEVLSEDNNFIKCIIILGISGITGLVAALIYFKK